MEQGTNSGEGIKVFRIEPTTLGQENALMDFLADAGLGYTVQFIRESDVDRLAAMAEQGDFGKKTDADLPH